MGSAGRPPADDVLTPSEWEVVHMVRHGMTNRRIAIQRGTSLDAVKFHLENIRAKLDLPSRASMRSWAGIPRHSLEARSMTTTGTSVALGALGQVSYTVKSLEPVVSFLKDTLGMTPLFTAGDLAFFDCNGTRLMVEALPEAQGNGNSVLYFRVEDIHGSVATLRARGVAFEGEPHMIHRHPDGTEEWMTFFRDPEGNMLSLMSQVKP
jgi:DNA-binding CsgD family transcriptional regulator/catechol 2,3-dioxygenase-like lactoylglutathione lyase family enzyme